MTRATTPPRPWAPTAARSAQRGAVLAMALIFLVILALVGAFTMRGSIVGEQVSKNIRSSQVAAQAAESALRFCEDLVRSGQITLPQPLDENAARVPTQWNDRANWTGNVTSDEFVLRTFSDSGQTAAAGMRALPTPPQCMVERMSLPPAEGEPVKSFDGIIPWQITAVGYSADFARDASGNGSSGSEVWLQSILIP